MQISCSVEQCGRPVTAKGLCAKHYTRWSKHGDPLVVLKQYDHPATCTIEDCERPYATRGLCSMHYGRLLDTGSTDPRPRLLSMCRIEDCTRKHAAKGYCSMHLRRLQKHGDPLATPSRRRLGTCKIEGCEIPALARDLCSTHYARWKKHGDPSINKRAAGKIARAVLDWRDAGDLARLNWMPVGGGYRGATWPEHPNANTQGRVAEHVAVMASSLGRSLRRGEEVHHRNGQRDDNRLENLELWTRAHPPGQRVVDLLAWAKQLLDDYADTPQLLSEADELVGVI